MTSVGRVKTPALAGLPQLLSYASTFPDPTSMLQAIRSGPLVRRGMQAGFIWMLVDGTHLVSVGHVGWGREMVDRYAVIPLELDLPVAHSVLENRSTIDLAPAFGKSYLSSIDERFLGQHFEAMNAASIINIPLRRADTVVGAFGFVTSELWVDDDEGQALMTALAALLGMWATHPQSTSVDSPASLGQREWSLAFTERQKQVLALAGQGLSNTEIARDMVVSNSSVKQDLQHAMRALRTNSRTDAYERAVALHLLA